MHAHRPFPLLPLLLLLVAGCSPDQRAGAEEGGAATAAAAAPGVTLETARDLGVSNARMPRDGLLTAGQVSPDQIDALADGGFEHFVSLRPATEDGAGWEESWAADRPASFERVPVAGAAGLTRESAEALDRILDETAGEPTVVYCGSGNRVGALLALRAYWLEGASPEEALALGRSAGLTSLEPEVRTKLGVAQD